MKKRIAITGSSGFIGTYVINNSEFSILEVDLLVQKVEDIDFNGIDSVLHLAAFVHQMKGANEEQYYKVNRDLAFETAKAAKYQGVKQFILMSTVKVYGESTNNIETWNEESVCKPMDAYGKSKYEAEQLIKSIEDEEFKVAIIRSPLVYGAGVKANMYNLIKLVDRFPVLPLDGIDNQRSVVYVGNLDALIKMIINMQVSGIFIAGDQEPISTSTLCRIISNSLNKKVILFKVPIILIKWIKKNRVHVYNRLFGSLVVENTKTNEVLHFIPPFTTEQGIRNMVEWYKKFSN